MHCSEPQMGTHACEVITDIGIHKFKEKVQIHSLKEKNTITLDVDRDVRSKWTFLLSVLETRVILPIDGMKREINM